MTAEDRAARVLVQILQCVEHHGAVLYHDVEMRSRLTRAFRQAIAEEREACAKMLDGLGCSEFCNGVEHDGESCYQALAAAMRARS
jgi:hypothetical protein